MQFANFARDAHNPPESACVQAVLDLPSTVATRRALASSVHRELVLARVGSGADVAASRGISSRPPRGRRTTEVSIKASSQICFQMQ